MPTLFISYKRGTTAIAPIMNLLRDAKYRLWVDRDDIHLGDPDWQERIDRGLERSQGVILGITPAACDSKPIQYEVAKARELNLPIFPLILERVKDIPTALREIGLPDNQHVEDFTDVEHWDSRCTKLLADLNHQGLRVTRHDLRETRGEAAYNLHQRYLKRLVERIGRLQLSTIAPEQSDGVPLESVYVDGPTPLSISVEVLDWQVVDWWISQGAEARNIFGGRIGPHTRPDELGYEEDALESLIERVEQQIADYRERFPYDKPDDEVNIWKNGPHYDVLTLTAQDISAARDRLVILGTPGSGKSTFAKHLALCLAGEQISDWSRPANLAALGQWTHGALTPVYIELGRFVNSEYFPRSIHDLPTSDNLWRYIEANLRDAELADYADDLRQDLEQGHAVMILDGLDEVPYPERELARRQQQLRHLTASLNDAYGPSRIIVTSRPYAYEGWTLPGFEAVTLADFEDQHRSDLATRLYQAAGMPEDDARAKADRLNQALGPIDPQLKDRPLFLTLMATIFLRGDAEGLPTRRGALYRQSILLLLDRWAQTKPDVPALTDLLGGATLENLYDRLAALAYDVHSQYGDETDTPEIEEMLLYDHLQPMGRHVAADLIPYLSENAGVLVSPGQNHEHNVFYFAHRSFQEYLAAVNLVSQCEQAESFAQVGALVAARPLTWREPCKLTGDVLVDTRRKRDLWNLLDDLLADVPDTGADGDDPRWWRVWLAGEIASEQVLYSQERFRRGEATVRDDLVAALAALIQTPQTLDPVERSEAGRVLGYFGDPRPGVSLRPDGLPDIDWVEIPAGEFIMGSDRERDPEADDNETPQQTRHLDTYHISRYPITCVQYDAFVEDGGYINYAYWTGAGWEDKGGRKAPRYWNDPQWRFDNQPVMGVTWYEAYAFTQWLSVKLGVKVSLPTEAQWEKAARGTDGRIYPYGNEFDPTKCNTYATGIGNISAAGLFPDEASTYGVLGMSGNVCEWCLTKWRTSYGEPEDNDPAGSVLRVLRGGAWNVRNPVGSRSADRDYWNPEQCDNVIGFRAVCSRPPSL